MWGPIKVWWSMSAALLVAACAGSGDGLDANGRPIEQGGGGDGVLTADLASIQANVFTPVCTPCHIGANAPQGLRLDVASSYGALVGVASSEAPQVLRVKPGDPGSSYLVQKLAGRASIGARMPLGQPALPDATIQVIRQWITDGAPRTPNAAGALLAVQSISVTPAEIAVALTRPVDSSLVNASTVSLEHADDSPGTGPTIAVWVGVSPYSEVTILARPDRPLETGQYRLRLSGTAPVAIADWNAAALDGDGDEIPGGDATIAIALGDAG